MADWAQAGSWPAYALLMAVTSTVVLAAAWPLAWLLSGRPAAERHAARAAALRHELAHVRRRAALVLALARPATLRRRLCAVLDERRRSARLSTSRLVVVGLAAAALGAGIGAVLPATAAALPFGEFATGRAALSTLPDRDAPSALPQPAGAPVSPRPDTRPSDPAAPPVPAVVQERECWAAESRYVYGVGSIAVRSGTTIVDRGTASAERMIMMRSRGGVDLCRRSVGEVRVAADGSIASLGEAAWVVLATRDANGTRSLVITPAADGGLAQAWYVDGVARAFDGDAREWRDALQAVLHVEASIAELRGEEASLRGRIASVRGEEASLRGRIASTRGRVASLRGEIASVRGQEASLRGQISSVRARERSSADAARRIEELEARIRALDAENHARAIERRIEELGAEAQVREIEASIDRLDVEARVRAIEEQIRALDAERRARELEPLRGPAHDRLEAALRRVR